MSNQPCRIAVVGGGLSGLAAAHRLIELSDEKELPIELTVYEASQRFGGVMGTRQIGDYLVETGADSFITNKPWAVALCRRLGLEDQLIPTDAQFRRSLVLRNGRPVVVPEGFQLMAPAKIWPVLKSSIFSPWGKLRMGCEYFIPRRSTDEDESLASFVRRRFGQEALERLVQPLVGGIYTSDPEKLSLLATMPRFIEWEREFRSLIRAARKQVKGRSPANGADENASGARYGLFATLRGGISELLNALQNAVAKRGQIRRNSAVSRLNQNADGRWDLRFETGGAESHDAVVLAIPAFRAAALLPDCDSELGKSLTEIEYASTAIVVSGHKLSDVSHPLGAFGLVIPIIENRRILAVSFTSRKFPNRAPEGCVQLRTFVGGAMQARELEQSDEEIQKLVLRELSEILGVQGEPDFVHLTRWNRAMPQYHLGHLDRVAKIESRANALPRFALAGNAYHGVGIPDCIHSGEQAAEEIFYQLTAVHSDAKEENTGLP